MSSFSGWTMDNYNYTFFALDHPIEIFTSFTLILLDVTHICNCILTLTFAYTKTWQIFTDQVISLTSNFVKSNPTLASWITIVYIIIMETYFYYCFELFLSLFRTLSFSFLSGKPRVDTEMKIKKKKIILVYVMLRFEMKIKKKKTFWFL